MRACGARVSVNTHHRVVRRVVHELLAFRRFEELDPLHCQLTRLGYLADCIVLVLSQRIHAIGRSDGTKRLAGLVPHHAVFRGILQYCFERLDGSGILALTQAVRNLVPVEGRLVSKPGEHRRMRLVARNVAKAEQNAVFLGEARALVGQLSFEAGNRVRAGRDELRWGHRGVRATNRILSGQKKWTREISPSVRQGCKSALKRFLQATT